MPLQLPSNILATTEQRPKTTTTY